MILSGNYYICTLLYIYHTKTGNKYGTKGSIQHKTRRHRRHSRLFDRTGQYLAFPLRNRAKRGSRVYSRLHRLRPVTGHAGNDSRVCHRPGFPHQRLARLQQTGSGLLVETHRLHLHLGAGNHRGASTLSSRDGLSSMSYNHSHRGA